MIRLAANLSMMFNEHDFLDRFDVAARHGFGGVEYLFPYELSVPSLREVLNRNGLQQVLFNLPAGNWLNGERGLACLPGRETEFKATVDLALRYAQGLDCHRLHVMAGVMPYVLDRKAEAVYRRTYLNNLGYAARELAKHGCDLLIEPINTRDMPGYYLRHQAQAMEIIAQVNEPNLKLQFDVYHCQIMDGDLIYHLNLQFPAIGHVQVAGVPGRNEPDRGEVHYPAIFERLETLGYQGWVGCEYHPLAATADGLVWGRHYGLR